MVVKSNITNKDPSAKDLIAEIYEEFYPLMKKIALDITHNPEDAEDVIIQTCIQLIPKEKLLSSLERPARIMYLRTAVRNTAIKLVAHRKPLWERAKEVERLYLQIEDSSEDAYLREEGFFTLLSGLKQRDKDLLFLAYYLGHDHHQIAKETGLNAKTVASYLFRARAKIKKRLEEGDR